MTVAQRRHVECGRAKEPRFLAGGWTLHLWDVMYHLCWSLPCGSKVEDTEASQGGARAAGGERGGRGTSEGRGRENVKGEQEVEGVRVEEVRVK